MGKRTFAMSWVLAVGVVVGVGCSELRTSASKAVVAPVGAPASAPLSLAGDARELRFLFVPTTEDAVSRDASEAIRQALVRAGFSLVSSPSAEYDARLDVALKRSPVPEAWDETYLQVSLAVRRGDDTVEWLVAPAGDPTSFALAGGLVDRLVSSPAMVSLTSAHRRDTAVHRSMVAGPNPVVPIDARTLDDAAWSPAAARQCRNGRAPAACEKLEAYVASFPEGAHAPDARAILSRARARSGQSALR